MFDKVKSLIGLTPAPAALTAALKVLKADVAGRYEAVLAYVVNGASPEVVMAIESSPQTTRSLLREPGKSWWLTWHQDLAKQVQKAVPGLDAKSVADAINALITDRSVLTAQQWTRLGRVFAACSNADFKRTKGAVPEWLIVLLEILLRSRSDKLWPIEFLDELLIADGGIEAPADVCVVTLRCCVEGSLSYGEKPFLVAGVGEYAASHVDAFRQAVSEASLAGKLNALEYIKTNPILWQAVPDVLQSLAVASSKQVRDKALNIVTGLPSQLRLQVLIGSLAQASPANAGAVVDHLARMGAEGGHAVLEAELSTASGKLAEIIQTALRRTDIAFDAPKPKLVVPPCPALDTTPLTADFVSQLKTALDAWVVRTERNLSELRAVAQPSAWQRSRIKHAEDELRYVRSLTGWQYDQVLDFLNGERKRPDVVNKLVGTGVFYQIKGLGLPATIRLATRESLEGPWINWHQVQQVVDADCDLRLLLAAAIEVGVPDAYDVVARTAFTWRRRTPELAWPLFAEQPKRLEQALGLQPIGNERYYNEADNLAIALSILAEFPVLPTEYVARVAEIALGAAKTNRLAAQRLLESQPNGLAIACQGLTNPAGEVRSSAAAWLARIGDVEAVPDLRAALKSERQEAVQAALLSALSRLGDDISSHLSPEVLLAKARKGLKAKPPADLAWLPMLPRVRWADSQPVEPEIIDWWARLAFKLKDPAGAGLIPIYIGLLEPASQQELGGFVLDAWIAQDTATVSDEEARAYATIEAPLRYQRYQDYAKRYKGDFYTKLASLTMEQVFDQARREKLGEYLGSAIASKGLLSLTAGAPGHHVLQSVRRYIRDHGGRRAQVEALVIAAACNDDPAAIQLVLGVARRHKQATVQAKAQELAGQLAERKGWTAAELADRTIPAAGFDDNRTLSLDYGPRQFVGRIAVNQKTAAWGIDLFTTEGKPVKALPSAGVADDAELVKQARAQLTVAKKELKQVVELQTARLFEAMCLGRTWQAQSWQDDLLSHPVMAYLISGLVWVEHSSGSRQRLFRPTLEGELVDVDDETVELAAASRIGLAHVAVVLPDQAQAWRRHLQDYQVRTLFEQFQAVVPSYPDAATRLSDRRGWLSDSFAIRTRATKRGYSRAQSEDGGWFSEYIKGYSDAGIQVSIQFTGSCLPEEQIPAAVTDLVFERTGRRGGEMKLSEVPPILLAESHRDYIHIAEAGAFDPDWQNKSAF